jgi:hypothetical protein
MSYDLMVFDPSAAPRGREQFRDWFAAQTEWTEGHGYNDPKVPSEKLQDWYCAVTREFPNLNGEGVLDDDIGDHHTDYSLGSNVIYAAFAWTEAEEAYETTRRLAVESGVGFYDVSGDEGNGEIYFPGDEIRPPSGGKWRSVAKQFRELRDNE